MHKMEMALWAAADLDTATFVQWYKPVGAGMGASLNTAAAMSAYVISDRASRVNFANKRDLALLYAGDPALFSQYAYIPVNPVLHPHVKADVARLLENCLVSDTAKALINGYMLSGEPLLTFNAVSEKHLSRATKSR